MINTITRSVRAGGMIAPALTALMALLPVGAFAYKPPVKNPDFTSPALQKPNITVTKSAPTSGSRASAVPTFAGVTCRSESNGGMVAFDSALAISRRGAQAIPVTGWRTLYHLRTPDTLRKLSILNPGRGLWEIIGKEGIIREGVAEGAFVSFDAVTGRVVGVAVYQINRAAEKEPQAVRIGDNIVLQGRFLLVADAHQGRTILQRGGSQVSVNARTGSIALIR